MAHHMYENDGMLSVGETPWHGLGVTMAEPPGTALEGLQIAGLDIEVAKEPMFDRFAQQIAIYNERKDSYAYPGLMVRLDKPQGDPCRNLGVVGPSYAPLQNREMAAIFEPLVADGTITIETVGSLFNGKRVWMLGRFGNPQDVESGDQVKSYLMLAHGHDGTFAIRFGFTPIRVVCYNTLSAAVEEGRSSLVRCLHTMNAQKNLEILRDSMCEYSKKFELSMEQYRLLASRGVSRADLKRYAQIVVTGDETKTEADMTSFEIKKAQEIVAAAAEGRGNRARNWWHAYNGVTEYVNWSAGRIKDNRLSEAWWGEGAAMNQRALTLALEMSA